MIKKTIIKIGEIILISLALIVMLSSVNNNITSNAILNNDYIQYETNGITNGLDETIYDLDEMIVAFGVFEYQNINETRVLIEFNNSSKVYDLSVLNYDVLDNGMITFSKELDNPGIGIYELIIKVQNDNLNYEKSEIIKVVRIGYNLTNDNLDSTFNNTENNVSYENDTLSIEEIIDQSNISIEENNLTIENNPEEDTNTEESLSTEGNLNTENDSNTEDGLNTENNLITEGNLSTDYNLSVEEDLIAIKDNDTLINEEIEDLTTDVLNKNEFNEIQSANVSNANVSLYVYDTTDYNETYVNQTVFFYANFTNSTNISILNATCKIQFNTTTIWSDNYNMSYIDNIYQYNSSFNVSGTFYYNSSCTSTYGNLSVVDVFVVSLNNSNETNSSNTPIINPTVLNITLYKNYGDYIINLSNHKNEDYENELNWSIVPVSNNILNYSVDYELLTFSTIEDMYGISSFTLILKNNESGGNNNDTQNVSVFVPSISLSSINELIIGVNNTNSTDVLINISGYKASFNLTVNNTGCSLSEYEFNDIEIGITNTTLTCNFSYSQNITDYVLIDTDKNENLTITLIPKEPVLTLTQIGNYRLVAGGSIELNATLSIDNTQAYNVSNIIDCPLNWECIATPNNYSLLGVGTHLVSYSINVFDNEVDGIYRINYSAQDEYGRNVFKYFNINTSLNPLIEIEKNNLGNSVDVCKDINYSIYFNNKDNINLTNITIVDYVPSGIYIKNWSSENNLSSITYSGDVWHKDLVLINENFTLNINMGVYCNASGYIINKANVTYNWNTTSNIKRQKNNEIVSNSVFINKPKIELNIAPSSTLKNLNDISEWTITIHNSGNASAMNTIINKTIGSGFSYINFSDMSNITHSKLGNGINDNHSIEWILNVTPGDTWSATISGEIIKCDEDLLSTHFSSTKSCGCDEFNSNINSNTTLRKIIMNKSSEKYELSIGELNKYTIKAQVCGEYQNITISDSFTDYVNTTINTSYISKNFNIKSRSSSSGGIFGNNVFEWIITNTTGDVSSIDSYFYMEFNISQYVNNNSNDLQTIENNVSVNYYNISGAVSDVFYNTFSSSLLINYNNSKIIVYEPNVELNIASTRNTENISDVFRVDITLTNAGQNTAYNITINNTYIDGAKLINSSRELTFNNSEILMWNINELNSSIVITNWYFINETYRNMKRVLSGDILDSMVDIRYYSYDINNTHDAIPRKYINNDLMEIEIDTPYINLDTYRSVFAIGEKITYDINLDFSKIYSNNVTLINIIPDNTNFINFTNTSYVDFSIGQDGNNNILVFDFDNITTREMINLTIDVYVNTTSFDSEILSNNISLMYYNSSNYKFSIDQNIEITAREPTIILTKELISFDVSDINSIIQYNITLNNIGLYDALNVTAIDNVSDGLSFNTSSIIPGINNRQLTWNFGIINRSSSKEILINLSINKTYDDGLFVTANDSFDNYVSISYYGFNKTIADEYGGIINSYSNHSYSDKIVEIVQPKINIYHEKVEYTIGELVTYNINIDFNKTAGNYVNISSIINDSVIFVNSSSAYNIDNNLISWYLFNVSQEIININYSVYINNSIIKNIDSKDIINNFKLSYQSSNITGNESDVFKIYNKTIVVIKEPKLVIDKNILNSNVNLIKGDVVKYNITVRNIGNYTAFNVTLKDVIDDGLVFSNVSQQYVNLNDFIITWDLGSIQKYTYKSILLNLTINNTYRNGLYTSSNDSFSNFVNVSYFSYNDSIANQYLGTIRNYEYNKTSENVTLINPEISKIAELKNMTIGQHVNYTIVISMYNNLLNMSIKDLIPTGLIYINDSHYDYLNKNGNELIWNFNDKLSDDFNITIQTYLNDSVLNKVGVLINNNSASINYTNINSDYFNIYDASNKILITEPNLTITKEVISNSILDIGDIISYNITVINKGTSEAYNITLVDKIINGTYYNTSNPAFNNIQNGIIYWNYGKIEPNEIKNILVNFSINSTYSDLTQLASGDILRNKINMSYSSYNQTLSNVFDAEVRSYSNGAISEYVTITAPNIAKYLNPSRTQSGIGENIDYTIELNFSAAANNVTLKDIIPEFLNVYNYSLPGDAVLNDNIIDWDLGRIEIGNYFINIRTYVNDSAYSGQIINANFINFSYIDSNNTKISITDLSDTFNVKEPKLNIDIELLNYKNNSDTNNSNTSNDILSYNLKIGDIVRYNITVKNTGNFVAYNVSIYNLVPDGFYYYNSSIDYLNFNDDLIMFNYQTINHTSQNIKSLIVDFKVNDTYKNNDLVLSNDSIYNYINVSYYSYNQTAALTYNGSIKEYFNSSYSDNITLINPSISKSANASFAYEGEMLKYSIIVNASNGLSGLIIKDIIPEGLTYVTNNYNGYSSINGNLITWEFGNLTNQLLTIDLFLNVTSSPIENDGVYINNNSVNLTYQNSVLDYFNLIDDSNKVELNIPPEQVGLLLPIDDFNTTSRILTFDWNDSIDKDQVDSFKYFLEISNSTGFESLIVNQNISVSSYTLTQSLDDDNYYWRIKICDNSFKLNNCSYSITDREFSVDNTPPNITIFEPDSNEILAWMIYLISNATDSFNEVSSVWYKISNGTIMQDGFLTSANGWETTWNTNGVISNSSDINYFNFIVYANDTLNNIATKNVTFVVDNRNPGLQIIYPDKTYHNTAFDLDIRLSNEHLNYSWFEINYSNGVLFVSNLTTINNPNYNWTQEIIPVIEDNYSIVIYVEDEVGNNISKRTSFIYDVSSPTYNLYRTPTPSYTTDNITLTVSVSDNYKIDTVFIVHNASGVFDNFSTTYHNTNDNNSNGSYEDNANYTTTINYINTTNQEHIGWYSWINDSAGNVNITSMQIINVINRIPIFNPIVENKVIYEDSLFVYDINASDYDYEDSIVFSDNVTEFNISINSGIISWTPENDDVGNLSINITICDNSSADVYCNSSVFILSIINTNDAPSSVDLGLLLNDSLINYPKPRFNWSLVSDVDVGDILKYFLIIDDSSDFSSPVIYQNISDVSKNEYELTNSQNLSDARYYWRILSCDNSYTVSNCTYSNTNYTFVVDQTKSSVSLISPIDYFNSSINNVSFECSSVDNYILKNISLYTNRTGWHKELSADISGSFNNSVFNLTNVTDGIYNWNCLVYDLAGNKNWGINRTVRVDTTAPNRSIVNPVNGAQLGYTTTLVVLEIETDEVSSCSYNTTNSSFNFSSGIYMESNLTIHTKNFTVSTGASYTIYYKCNDSFGNINNESLIHSFSVAQTPSSGGGGSSSEPSESEDCSDAWSCSPWTPTTCSSTERQNRICTCSCSDESDCSGDGSEMQSCTYVSSCSDGFLNQDESDIDCGGICNTCNIGKTCVFNADCNSGLCSEGKCSISGCDNDIKDGDETDIDCGGSCNTCNIGLTCGSNDDCLSKLCTSNICVNPTCDDGFTNQDESDIDCGGELCLGCLTDEQCNDDSDCNSDYCNNNKCSIASCSDGVFNQDETDIDCGGILCDSCALGESCDINQDCLTDNCVYGTCEYESCVDEILNQDESDVDCGGSVCDKCSVSLICSDDVDCESNYCYHDRCSIASCNDEIFNQDESDIDCGGSTCEKCGMGFYCSDNNDCANNNCISNTCSDISCTDENLNNDESDIDCGGTCPDCDNGKLCTIDSDCLSRNCEDSSNRCSEASCDDSSLNQDESDIDCGGSCNGCNVYEECNEDGDCNSNFCNLGQCNEPSCNDNIQNGDESDIDCGGSCYACVTGNICFSGGDCLSLFCNDFICRQASCDDTIKNQDESDVDCGGPCNKCSASKLCIIDSDCSSNFCSFGICEASSCEDMIWNGNEESVDCGGECISCASCEDGIQNGNEEDIDCGGSCPACFLECSDGSKVLQCLVLKPQLCNSNLELVNDCLTCGCPNANDICLDNVCSGIGNCQDGIQNNGETGVDCGGSACEECDATCDDRVKNQDEEGVDCGGSTCEECAKEVILEKPMQTEYREIEIINLVVLEGGFKEFEIGNEKHKVIVNQIYDSSVDISIQSDPIDLTINLSDDNLIDLDSDGVYEFNIILKKITDKTVYLQIKLLDYKKPIMQNIFDIFGADKRESSINPDLIKLENMPCRNDLLSKQSKLLISESALEFDIPRGFDALGNAFKVDCDGVNTNLTLSIPMNYEDVSVIKCNGDCETVKLNMIDELSCGAEFSKFSSNEKYAKQIKKDSVIKKVNYDNSVNGNINNVNDDDSNVNNDNINNSNNAKNNNNNDDDDNKITLNGYGFTFKESAIIEIGNPKNIVRQPHNELLKIISSPVKIKSDMNLTQDILVSFDLVDDKSIDEDSQRIYVKTSKDNWKMLDGEIISGKVIGTLKTPWMYIDNNNEIVISQIGKVCANCKYSTLQKEYEPNYPVKDAVLMVHGFGASPKTFEGILKDIRLTKQPWIVYSFGYPTEKSVLNNAIELANHLEQKYNEFDYMYIAAHSMGGLVVRDALYYSYTVNLEKPGTYKFIDKIKKVVLIGTPNKGSPGANTLLNLAEYLTNIKSGVALIDIDTPGMQDLINGKDTPSVPGIKYYSIAGTKSFNFGTSLLDVKLFEEGEINDGVVSLDSATNLNGTMINNRCDDFWDIKEIHTELLDNPISRTIIEKIIASEINKDVKNKAILGNQVYYDLELPSCTGEYVIIGKKSNPNKALDETGCLCGNGYCGIGEDEVNCPVDCATLLNKENVCKSLPFGILVLLLTILIIGAPYVFEKYIKKLTFSNVLKKKIIFLLMKISYVMIIVDILLFMYYRNECISYYDIGFGGNLIISLGGLSLLLLLYEWYVYKFKKEEKELEEEFKWFKFIVKMFKLHAKLFLWSVWGVIVLGFSLFMLFMLNMSEETFANWILNILMILFVFIIINTINFLIYEQGKIKTGREDIEKRIEKNEKYEKKEIKIEKKKIKKLTWNIILHKLRFKKDKKEIVERDRIRRIEKQRVNRLKKFKKEERKEKIRIYRIRRTKIWHKVLHKLGLHYTEKQKEELLEEKRIIDLDKARVVRAKLKIEEEKKTKLLQNKMISKRDKIRHLQLIGKHEARMISEIIRDRENAEKERVRLTELIKSKKRKNALVRIKNKREFNKKKEKAVLFFYGLKKKFGIDGITKKEIRENVNAIAKKIIKKKIVDKDKILKDQNEALKLRNKNFDNFRDMLKSIFVNKNKYKKELEKVKIIENKKIEKENRKQDRIKNKRNDNLSKAREARLLHSDLDKLDSIGKIKRKKKEKLMEQVKVKADIDTLDMLDNSEKYKKDIEKQKEEDKKREEDEEYEDLKDSEETDWE